MMRRVFILAMCVLGVSCSSQPPAAEESSASATKASSSEKMTNAPADEHPGQVELMAVTTLSPRRESDLESGILLDHGIQNCLRADLKTGEAGFSVKIEGKIGKGGDIHEPVIVTPHASLKTCLEKRLKRVDLGRGKSGTFKMRVEKAGFPPPGKKAQKTILLDLEPVKKFQ